MNFNHFGDTVDQNGEYDERADDIDPIYNEGHDDVEDFGYR